MASEYTTHYNLDLYTDTDKPNLRDQYNGAMNKIDSQLNTFSNNMVIVTDAANQAKEKANTNATEIADEVTRAKAAEQVNATAVSDEVTRAKAAEKTNATAISNEVTRAKGAESVLNTLITSVTAKQPKIFSTVADMVSSTLLNTGDYALVLGYHKAGFGSGLYYVNDNDTANAMDAVSVNGHVATLQMIDDFVNVAALGTPIDTDTDSAKYINRAIELSIENNKDIYFPAGKYYVKSDINGFPYGIRIFGSGTSNNTNEATIIYDNRNESSNALMRQNGTLQQRSIFENIRFIGSGINTCFKIVSQGWVGTIKNIVVENFATAFSMSCDDYNIENTSILNCGNSENAYAIDLNGNANQINFTNSHIEYCSHIVKSSDTAFWNSFNECHIEQTSKNYSYDNNPPIYVSGQTDPDHPPMSFNDCYISSLGALAYIDKGKSWDSVPYLIGGNTQCFPHFTNCNFAVGDESNSTSGFLMLCSLPNARFNNCTFRDIMWYNPKTTNTYSSGEYFNCVFFILPHNNFKSFAGNTDSYINILIHGYTYNCTLIGVKNDSFTSYPNISTHFMGTSAIESQQGKFFSTYGRLIVTRNDGFFIASVKVHIDEQANAIYTTTEYVHANSDIGIKLNLYPDISNKCIYAKITGTSLPCVMQFEPLTKMSGPDYINTDIAISSTDVSALTPNTINIA